MTSFAEVLDAIREDAKTPREQGTLFERLMVQVLPQMPEQNFKAVWSWKDWPDRKRFSGMDGKDLGIDLVGQRTDDTFCAIQCKFYDETTAIQKGHIDSFFTELGKEPFETGLIITTSKWSDNAEKALVGQTKTVTRFDFSDLAKINVDWDLARPDRTKIKPDIKKLFPRQTEALKAVMEGFETHKRGKMIMACGTGKTLTSLHIAQKLVPRGGNILFLAPSISLLSQSLHEWAYQQAEPMQYLAVCSDTQVDKTQEDISVADLAIPATTDASKLKNAMALQPDKTNVVFCTYHSLERIRQAQQRNAPDFDLVICDEAHRTTGIDNPKQGETSYFSNINKEDYVKADKRLYMTATPRLYSEAAQAKAADAGITTFSMDDEAIYGPEFYRLNFSTAVEAGMLSDYKVLVLNIGQDYVNHKMQKVLASSQGLKIDDVGKIIGCYKALRDRGQQPNKNGEAPVMRRAVGFANTIKDSKKLKDAFSAVAADYDETEHDDFTCNTDHVDGTMSALERNKKLDWLRDDPGSSDAGEICNILFNARCLTEGVDVPSLDAVMFMQPRASEVDIVQAVGRVMRKAEGKTYGYIIVPVVVTADDDPQAAMQETGYKTVWRVLNALRAHDDRFNQTINKLDLNNKKPDQVDFIGLGLSEQEQAELEGDITSAFAENPRQETLDLWSSAIFSKMVEKCGERQYWENWAKDVADIHGKITARINALQKTNVQVDALWQEFYAGVKRNINDALTPQDATSMLAQHMITQPVFDALFEDYEFSVANPVSQNMSAVIARLHKQGLEAELESLNKFYQSVRDRASGIDNPEGRQRVIIELYEKFFKTAFPKTAESLGIAYTPIEIVDFVLASADHALQQEFGRSLSDENVHIIDPFTGTGSFINRLIQSDLIKDKDLPRKFAKELHANEILLLAYYIAGVNIEEAYHHRTKQSNYEAFPGLVLTDTFNLYERASEETGSLEERIFPENNARVTRQRNAPIRVVVGNPPWSAGQKLENDAAKNMAYPKLDASIRKSYAEKSKATLKRKLYDSYIRSFRWASDRIGEEGVIAFVSPSAWIDRSFGDGMRQTLQEEFTSLHIFDLRGDIRKNMFSKGAAREGQNVFGSASMNGVAISVLVRSKEAKQCQIYYHDIGDDLSRQAKIEKITKTNNIGGLDWQKITPNPDNDWINQRDPLFQTFKSMGSKDVKAGKISQPDTIFRVFSNGVVTNRDSWVYNFSYDKLAENMQAMIEFYNEQVEGFQKAKEKYYKLKIDDFIDNDPSKIKWTRGLKANLKMGKVGTFSTNKIRSSVFRPFEPEWIYFDKQFNSVPGQMPSFFPKPDSSNKLIAITSIGARQNFSVLMSDSIIDINALSPTQTFPRYYWNEKGEREDNITDACLREFQAICQDDGITGDDIFDYVYGVLHAPDYQKRFANDLKKELPRIPMPADAAAFAAFRKAGAQLAELHLNFETGPEYPLDILVNNDTFFPYVLEELDYKVKKMKWRKIGKIEDKTHLVYNNQITLGLFPDEAAHYQISGRSALQWLIDRYQVKTDKDSKITNDPNDWIEEQNDPQWLIKHIKRITYISVESTKIIKTLPPAVPPKS